CSIDEIAPELSVSIEQLEALLLANLGAEPGCPETDSRRSRPGRRFYALASSYRDQRLHRIASWGANCAGLTPARCFVNAKEEMFRLTIAITVLAGLTSCASSVTINATQEPAVHGDLEPIAFVLFQGSAGPETTTPLRRYLERELADRLIRAETFFIG